MTILKDYYEKDAERFWDPTRGLLGRDSIIYPLLQDLSGNVLEYGCGAGSLITHLAQEARFSSVTGIDISENALKAIDRRIHEVYPEIVTKLNLRVPIEDKLPFLTDGCIDVVISVATVEHVLDPYRVLDELHRVARPGATLICSVPNYAYLKHRIALLFGDLPRTGTDEPVDRWRTEGWDGMHLHCFTQRAFATLLRDTGWQPMIWTGWGDRFNWLKSLRQRYPGLLSGEIIAVCKKNVK